MQRLTDTKIKVFAAVLMAAALAYAGLRYVQYARPQPAARIGVLHSLSGAMATREAPLVDALRLAVEEENLSGGVNGRQIELTVADCRSDAAYCAAQAEKLIGEGVHALFGCWTSDCRKAVKTVVEKHDHLLFYPLQYEGLELSPNVFHTGAAPNQQVIPMALWALRQHGKRFYLIGSDYVFPRTANYMIKHVLLANGGRLLGERYLPHGAGDMTVAIREIAAKRPDFVVNTLSGESNLHFFRELHEAGIEAANVPVFSTSVAETELAAMGAGLMAGHYAAWSYFQSVDSDENRAFVARFKRRYGGGRVLDDPMEASYIGLKLWAKSVRNTGTTDLALVRKNLELLSMDAPQGIVAADFDTMLLWKKVRIGKAREDGQFDIVWQSRAAIHPAPFPFYLSRSEWLAAAGGLSRASLQGESQ